MSAHIPIIDAIKQGNVTDALMIMKAEPEAIHAKDCYTGASAIHHAAYHGAAGTIRMLIKHGANPNAEDDTGCRPLHYSVNGESFARTKQDCLRYRITAQTLINAEADIHHVDDDGFQAMHLAAFEDAITLFKVLIDNGADIEKPTSEFKPRTAYELAVDHDCEAIKRYLDVSNHQQEDYDDDYDDDEGTA